MMTLFFALVFELLTELTSFFFWIFSFPKRHRTTCQYAVDSTVPHRALLINDGMQNLKQLFAYRSNI